MPVKTGGAKDGPCGSHRDLSLPSPFHCGLGPRELVREERAHSTVKDPVHSTTPAADPAHAGPHVSHPTKEKLLCAPEQCTQEATKPIFPT